MKRLAAAALIACGLTACKHMEVPAELKSETLAIEEKPGLFSGNLRFGPFKALEIDKGWIHGGSSTTTWFTTTTQTEQSQDFSFKFEEQGQPVRVVACRAAYAGETSSLALGKLGAFTSSDGHQTLDCKFGPPGAPVPDGILRLADDGPGRIEVGETVLELVANHSFEGGGSGGTTGRPLGYVLTSKGAPVAAIDSNIVGAWMKKDLPATLRTGAGLGSAILLLYQPQEPRK